MGKLFTIVRATLADLDALVELENNAFKPADSRLSRRTFRHHIRSHNVLLVAKGSGGSKDILYGYVLVFVHKKSARIYSMAVRSDRRGQGIAHALMECALAETDRPGIQRVVLEVRPTNRRAIGLYQRFGFCTRKRIPDYYPDGSPAMRMERLQTISKTNVI